MKKNEIFVKINSKEEAKNVKRVLKALGENKISNLWSGNANMLYFNDGYKKWCYAISFEPKENLWKQVTLKELIKIISSEEEQPKELEVGKWYLVDRNFKDKHKALVFYTGEEKTFGFNHSGVWTDIYGGKDTFINPDYTYTLATKKEVFEALSKEAEKRYKGKKAKCLHGCKDYDHNSDFNGLRLDNDGCLRYKDGCGCLFDRGRWAEIIKQPKSILDGEVAIKVNNEREAHLVLSYMAKKGWKWKSGNSYPEYNNGACNNLIVYGNPFSNYTKGNENYFKGTIIPFEDFAKEVGIEVPEFALKSEDGVDLYFGDQYYCVELLSNKANFCENKFNDLFPVLRKSLIILKPEEYKAFSTKEAALKFVEDFNKPKEIFLFQDEKPTKVTKYGFGTEHYKKHSVEYSANELEQIYQAYKSLQS